MSEPTPPEHARADTTEGREQRDGEVDRIEHLGTDRVATTGTHSTWLSSRR